MRETASVLDDFETADNITLGVSESLAVFFNDQLSDLVNVFADFVLESEHVSLTDEDGNLRPSLESLRSSCDCLIELCISRLGSLSDQLLSSWVADLVELSSLRGLPLAIDKVLEDLDSVINQLF